MLFIYVYAAKLSPNNYYYYIITFARKEYKIKLRRCIVYMPFSTAQRSGILVSLQNDGLYKCILNSP